MDDESTTVKPRVLPRNTLDLLISVGVAMPFFFIAFILPALTAAIFFGFLVGVVTYFVIGILFWLFVVHHMRVSREHIQFVRVLGTPKRLLWSEITSIELAPSSEVVLKGWLWPAFPTREMTPSLTCVGHYRIRFKGGYVYYPPRDSAQFEELVSRFWRSGNGASP